jgi:hypothetical protein
MSGFDRGKDCNQKVLKISPKNWLKMAGKD